MLRPANLPCIQLLGVTGSRVDITPTAALGDLLERRWIVEVRREQLDTQVSVWPQAELGWVACEDP